MKEFYSIETLPLDEVEEGEIFVVEEEEIPKDKKTEPTSSANLSTHSSRRKKNLVNSDEEVSHCNVCGSIFHWASRCPDAYPYGVSQKPEEVHITLFEFSSHDLSDGKMKDFEGETWSSAVLDTGCTKTVCGRN